jgi:hypothetical protein
MLTLTMSDPAAGAPTPLPRQPPSPAGWTDGRQDGLWPATAMTARAFAWASSGGGNSAWSKAFRPASSPSPCARSACAAAACLRSRTPRSALCRCRGWTRSPRPCSTFKVQTT